VTRQFRLTADKTEMSNINADNLSTRQICWEAIPSLLFCLGLGEPDNRLDARLNEVARLSDSVEAFLTDDNEFIMYVCVNEHRL